MSAVDWRKLELTIKEKVEMIDTLIDQELERIFWQLIKKLTNRNNFRIVNQIF